MMVPLHTFYVGGYVVDLWALLRIILGLWGIYNYQLFGKRLDAVFYQWRTRQLMSAFFVLEAAADIVLDAFGYLPTFLMLRAIGRFGIAFTVFSASQQTLKMTAMAAALTISPLMGVVRFADMELDVLSLASIALVLAAIRNFSIYSAILAPSRIQAASRRLFLLSVLASYVFQFIGVLLGIDLGTFVELSETMAVVIGFAMLMAVLKSDETRMATR